MKVVGIQRVLFEKEAGTLFMKVKMLAWRSSTITLSVWPTFAPLNFENCSKNQERQTKNALSKQKNSECSTVAETAPVLRREQGPWESPQNLSSSRSYISLLAALSWVRHSFSWWLVGLVGVEKKFRVNWEELSDLRVFTSGVLRPRSSFCRGSKLLERKQMALWE